MPVYVVRFLSAGEAHWGVVRGQVVTPIPGNHPSTGDFLRGTHVRDLKALRGPGLPLQRVELLAPITRTQQFLCQAANYREHMRESGVDPDAKNFNMIFTKATSSIVPAHHALIRPRHVELLDYEVELGVVLKRHVKSRVALGPDQLHEYVAGVVIVNDYTARDVQLPEMQFYKGKSFRTFGPVGPFLCLLEPEDFAAFGRLKLTLRVNGEVRQADWAENMVYPPHETISELSGVHDLYAGDLIATGTPSGCALSVPSPFVQRLAGLLPERVKWRMFRRIQARRKHRYLSAGDVVEASIRTEDGLLDLGVQRNPVIDEL